MIGGTSSAQWPCSLFRSQQSFFWAEYAKCKEWSETTYEGAVGNGAMTDIRLVGQIDFQDGDVRDDRGADGRDEEEDRGNEEEGYADPVRSVSGVA